MRPPTFDSMMTPDSPSWSRRSRSRSTTMSGVPYAPRSLLGGGRPRHADRRGHVLGQPAIGAHRALLRLGASLIGSGRDVDGHAQINVAVTGMPGLPQG